MAWTVSAEALNGITAKQATARPLPGAHNIWNWPITSQSGKTWAVAAWKEIEHRLTFHRRRMAAADDSSDAAWEQAKACSIVVIRHCVKLSRECRTRVLTSNL